MSASVPLRALVDNAVGDRIKAAVGWRVPWLVRPWSRRATVSDLFPWRCDGEWTTRFEIMNLHSQIVPEKAVAARATVFVYNAAGDEIERRSFDLPPFSARRLDFAQAFPRLAGHGAFACFHAVEAADEMGIGNSRLAERGYVGYRRASDPLWSYVHGNAHALALAPGEIQPRSIATAQPGTYRMQSRFDDCDRFELYFVNGLAGPAFLEVRLMDDARSLVEKRCVTVRSRATERVVVENTDRRIALVESDGARPAWRPLVFKYHDSHFDVFHG